MKKFLIALALTTALVGSASADKRPRIGNGDVNGICRIAPFADYGGIIPLKLSPGGKIVATVPTVSDVSNILDIVIFKGQKWAYVLV